MQETLFICVSPQMSSEMIVFILSESNDMHQFTTDDCMFAEPVAFPFPLELLFGAIADT
jgi:hypothetical protein